MAYYQKGINIQFKASSVHMPFIATIYLGIGIGCKLKRYNTINFSTSQPMFTRTNTTKENREPFSYQSNTIYIFLPYFNMINPVHKSMYT